MRFLNIHQEVRFFAQERAAAGCKNDLLDRIHTFACKTLEYSRMLTVNRNNRYSFLCSFLHHQFSGHNKGFLIGQTNGFARFYGREGRVEAGVAYNGTEHKIYGIPLYHLVQGIMPLKYFYIRPG
ncbi:hypothetical protein FQZ97_824850 [compost metagenome]